MTENQISASYRFIENIQRMGKPVISHFMYTCIIPKWKEIS